MRSRQIFGGLCRAGLQVILLCLMMAATVRAEDALGFWTEGPIPGCPAGEVVTLSQGPAILEGVSWGILDKKQQFIEMPATTAFVENQIYIMMGLFRAPSQVVNADTVVLVNGQQAQVEHVSGARYTFRLPMRSQVPYQVIFGMHG